jgi:hypothetical protein
MLDEKESIQSEISRLEASIEDNRRSLKKLEVEKRSVQDGIGFYENGIEEMAKKVRALKGRLNSAEGLSTEDLSDLAKKVGEQMKSDYAHVSGHDFALPSGMDKKPKENYCIAEALKMLHSSLEKEIAVFDKCMAEASNFQAFIDANRTQQNEWRDLAYEAEDRINRIRSAICALENKDSRPPGVMWSEAAGDMAKFPGV